MRLMSVPNRYESRLPQFGLRSIMVVVSISSIALAALAEGRAANLLFLASMPFFAWGCIRVAIGFAAVVNTVLEMRGCDRVAVIVVAVLSGIGTGLILLMLISLALSGVV